MQLEKREWKEFYIKDIFITENKKNMQVPTGSYIHKKNLFKGSTPRITVTSQNNGVDGYWTSSDKNYRCFKNFISVSFLGTIFYHPYVASLDMKVHCLQLIHRPLNLYLSIFLITEIKKSIENASYGNQISSTDLPNKKIMLPVDEQGTLDYVFMEEYIKERKAWLIQKYKSFVGKKSEQKEDIRPLDSLEWATFNIDDIFTISSGKRFVAECMHPGTRPFIGAIDSRNGITNYISDINGSLDKNVLGVNYNGNGMVISFYHPYECLFTDDVKRFHLKHHEDNKYVLLFMKTVILQQKEKYNYGYKFNAQRMQKQKIRLPVDDHGNPDYDYMEQYSKNLMLRKYQQYLDYVGV